MKFGLAAVAVVATLMATANSAVTNASQRFAEGHECDAILASPHPSSGIIKAHMRVRCKHAVAKGHVEAQLWRLRWWGWEAIGTPGSYTNMRGGRTFDVAAVERPGGGCYYYRSTGSGYVVDLMGQIHHTPGQGVNYDRRYSKGLPPGCGTSW